MADILQNSKDNIDWDGLSWVDKKFSHPERQGTGTCPLSPM